MKPARPLSLARLSPFARLTPGALALVASAGLTCRYDPVPQDIIDSLGPESGAPSATHRPGQPCVACHSTYEGAKPAMAIGGTVYYQNSQGQILLAKDVLVRVTDSKNTERKACTNEAGNFWIEEEDWAELSFPLEVRAGARRMQSIVGRERSCGACHRLPDDEAIDKVTGASHTSAGVVVVSESDLGEPCSSAAPVGGGGAGTGGDSNGGGGASAGGGGTGGAATGGMGGMGGMPTQGGGGAGGGGGA